MTKDEYYNICEMLLKHGIPKPSWNHKYAADDRHFDLSWPMFKIAIEIKTFISEAKFDEYNKAQAGGWTVLFITPQNVPKKAFIEAIQFTFKLHIQTIRGYS